MTEDLRSRTITLTIDGMEHVRVEPVIRRTAGGAAQNIDIYHPPRASDARPAVLIVGGYPDGDRGSLKDFGWTTSMGRLIAASNLIAIAYTTRDPAADVHGVLDWLLRGEAGTAIDRDRIGVLSGSGNVPTALSLLMRNVDARLRCAVFMYGCLLDADGANDVAEASRAFGFANPVAGRSIEEVRGDVPMLIVRAGRDTFPAMTRSTDRFIRDGLAGNLPISLINYPDGVHAFDLFDDRDASRAVVRQVLAYVVAQLAHPPELLGYG